MNNNEIKNPKTEVSKGTNLNDKDYMNNVLSCLKEMSKNYCVALTEASNEYLYDKYLSMFNIYSKLQRDVYEVMFRMGWYTLKKAEEQKISNKQQMLKQELTDLNG